MTDCPNCGLSYNTAKAPGFSDPWDYGKVMLNPCTCVVSQEELDQ